MYITNPTPEMLEKWYKTNAQTGRFLIDDFGISPIHIDNKHFYYFVNNDLLKGALDKLPFYMKIYNYFKKWEYVLERRGALGD